MRRYAAVAGVPDRLAHPHALRGYYATTLASERVPIQEIKARLGHGSIETTARYLAELHAAVKALARSWTAITRLNGGARDDARARRVRTEARASVQVAALGARVFIPHLLRSVVRA